MRRSSGEGRPLWFPGRDAFPSVKSGRFGSRNPGGLTGQFSGCSCVASAISLPQIAGGGQTTHRSVVSVGESSSGYLLPWRQGLSQTRENPQILPRREGRMESSGPFWRIQQRESRDTKRSVLPPSGSGPSGPWAPSGFSFTRATRWLGGLTPHPHGHQDSVHLVSPRGGCCSHRCPVTGTFPGHRGPCAPGATTLSPRQAPGWSTCRGPHEWCDNPAYPLADSEPESGLA